MKDTLKFDFKKCEFVVENGNVVTVTGLEALKVWIDKILHTQLGRYKIYSGSSYGANIEDLVIGKSYGLGFTQSELKREIETALVQNDDIHSVTDFSVTQNGDKLTAKFTLNTSYGEEEYTYDG